MKGTAVICWECNISFHTPKNSNVENLPPRVLRLVYKEVTALAADPPEGIKIYPSEEDITELHTAIEGPGITWSYSACHW